MRSRVLTSGIVLSFAFIACSGPTETAPDPSDLSPTESAPEPSTPSPTESFSRLDVYLPLLDRLVNGRGDTLFVQSEICRGAEGVAERGEPHPCDDMFTQTEMAEIARAFPHWKRVRFVRRYEDIPEPEQPINHDGRVYVWVGPLKEHSETEYRIGAGMSCGGLCGGGGTFLMQMENGSWVSQGYAPGTGTWIA